MQSSADFSNLDAAQFIHPRKSVLCRAEWYLPTRICRKALPLVQGCTPGVLVIATYAGGGHIVIVQMVPRVEGQVRSVLMAALSSQYNHPKIAIAVDEDVDPHDPKEVFWSISTRVSPQHDVLVIPDTYGIQIDNALPYMPPDEGSWRPRIGSKMLIDATRPPTRLDSARSQFERVSPRGLGEIDLEGFLGPIVRE